MRHLLYISFIFLCLVSVGQRKHLIKDGEIIQSGIPEKFVRENGEQFWGGYQNRTDLHYQDGWREEIRPVIIPDSQRLGQRYYDIGLNKVTWSVINYTPAELNEREEQRIQNLEDNIDFFEIKRILVILTKDLLATATPQELAILAKVYPRWRRGRNYLTNRILNYNGKLYRVKVDLTSRIAKPPDTSPLLYEQY